MAAEPVSPLVAPTTVRWWRSVFCSTVSCCCSLLGGLRLNVYRLRTLARLALVLAHEKVLKQVADKLQRHVFKRKRRPVEQLEQVVAVAEVHERRRVGVAKRRVAALHNVAEVGGRDLVRGDVERQNLVGQVGKGEVLPGLPAGGRGDGLGDEEAAIGGEALEDNLLKGELQCVLVLRSLLVLGR